MSIYQLSVSAAILSAVLITSGCFRKSKPQFQPGSLSVADSHQLMVDTLSEIAQRSADENIFVGDRLARTKRDELKKLPRTAPLLERWLKTYQLGKAELHLGNESEAIRLLAEAHEMIRDSTADVKPVILQQFYFDTAVAYLRWGETQNCCRKHTPSSCIIPIQSNAVHTETEGSRRGIQWLEALLQSTDPEQPMHLAARWLLNLAYMTLGEYPDKVPAPYRIDGLDHQPKSTFMAWPNVAAEKGVATFSLAGGAIADDFDNDNDIDLVVSSWDPRESLRLFWNDGQGSFQEGTRDAQLGQILGGLNMTQTDYNNDGFIDLFVMRGGWLSAAGRHPNSLLRNNGDGTFTDVTITAGLALPQLPTQTAAWSDYDLDGDVDVYIGNESSVDCAAPCQLFRNEGDGTFVEVATKSGVTNDRLAKAVAWGDYDADRYPDLYVSNYRGANRLYRNQGDGTFKDVAIEEQVEGPDASFPTWFCDVNNDGRLDLFVAAYSGGIAELAAAMLGKPFDRPATLPRLYIHDGSRFTNQAESLGLVIPTHPMGANFGDLDSDGFVDFYLGTGWPEYHELMPNVLYHNQAGSAFSDVTNAARVGHLQKGHAVAMADFDNDGDLDLFEQMGGFVPGDKFFDVLYQNPGTEASWLKVKAVGKASNRAAIGAQIQVLASDGSSTWTVHRVVSSGGSFGANPLEQFIGLGNATSIVELQVFWPRTGDTDTYLNVQPNQRVVVHEGVDKLQ